MPDPFFTQFQTYLQACLDAYRAGDLDTAWTEYDSAGIVFASIPDSKTGTVEFKLEADKFRNIKVLLDRAGRRSTASSSTSNNPRFKVATYSRKGAWSSS